jgi:putative heme-binding domain-containing protein
MFFPFELSTMNRPPLVLACALLLSLGTQAVSVVAAAPDVIPHAQDKPPGPPLTPEEAIKKMTVPPGFSVELVAAEPDLVNPVAMTFDERGRVWVTESLEYPRREPGPGRDRVKVLEDTDGDGRADKVTVFAEGLNIPSGIAVGYGGVWVANAPDILFLQDTDGDGKADKQEVVVTGFGRDDTHELPNSLTWGPDGWLYGLNGVFNPSRIEQNGKVFEFTCALFRIHPRTREFQLFAEGTSNPWGVAWDTEGSAFVSACVIDHLWHLVERGYYIRQGGPYPPYTVPQGSIVKHKHQKAAYCGIHFFDSDAYPAEFRERLYMGNIHGNCLNVDVLQRDGSTYFATPEADFLSANDAWFMPVVQKTGPDGSLYVLDWYDRYHCYQDANRDPEGIDRLKGRLYRIRYQDTPRAGQFDLSRESADQLIERLHSGNVYYRDLAQRILSERNDSAARPKLEALVLNDAAPRKARMHALWALVGTDSLSPEFHQALLGHSDASYRAWGVRAAGNFGKVDDRLRERIVARADDPSPDVRLQVAVAANKLEGVDALPVLLEILADSGDDKLLPHVVWQNLHPKLEEQGDRYLELAAADRYRQSPPVVALMPRVIDRILGGRNPAAIAALVSTLSSEADNDPATLERCFATLTTRLATREITPEQLAPLKTQLDPLVQKILQGQDTNSLFANAALLAATWKDPRGVEIVRAYFTSRQQNAQRRIHALDALVAANVAGLEADVAPIFRLPGEHPVELRAAALAALARVDAPWVADLVLSEYSRLEPELRPRAIELLTERKLWAERLLEAIGREEIPTSALNANQVRQLLARGDAALAEKVTSLWGAVRTERDPRREQVIAEMRSFLRKTEGNAHAGQEVFARICGQCHKIYGQGKDVGPDITLNGRSSFEQLLSNVFDPSLVIGAAYQARTIVTADGRVLTGLVSEDSDARVVLKMQGGKTEVVPRGEIEVMKVSALSLMPEDLEKQLKPQELADLFAFITLDKPPSDPSARKLPGSQPIVPRATTDRGKFAELVKEIAPQLSTDRAGKRGLAIVAEHAGREGVLLTTPVNGQQPCRLQGKFDVPGGKKSRLVLSVSHEAGGAWDLTVRVDGAEVSHSRIEGEEPRWQTLAVDLSPYAGRAVNVELVHAAVDNRPDGALWAQIEVVSD